MDRQTVQTTILTHAPGNGSNYRIFVCPNPYGGLTWSWVPESGPIMGGWAAGHKGGELRLTAGKRNRADLDAIRLILDEVRT